MSLYTRFFEAGIVVVAPPDIILWNLRRKLVVPECTFAHPCINIFEFKMGDSYGKKRIYGFLAERFLSYWFNNYANPINWPVYFKDIS